MARTPNLVFIYSDQQRQDTMRCYGNEWIETPNLNALAERSFIFDRAYVAQPVCSPSRASIMTGLYPHTAGVPLNDVPLPADTPTIAELVSDEYVCGKFGRWHLGDDVIPQHGFDEWLSLDEKRPYSQKGFRFRKCDYYEFLEQRGYEPDHVTPEGARVFSGRHRLKLPEELQPASYLGDRAADFIDRHRERPFVLYVSTIEPHSPYAGPLGCRYDPDSLPTGPAFLQRPEGGSLLNRRRADMYMRFLGTDGDPSSDPYLKETAALDHDLTREAGWRTLRSAYFTNVTLVDRMVGSITNALRRNGLEDDTVVVFTSEHGDMLGDHGLLEKRALYDEAARVPLLISAPSLGNKSVRIQGGVSLVDLVPTLLDLLDQPIPEHIQGRSRVSVLRSHGSLIDNDVFIEHNSLGAKPERQFGDASINRMLAWPWRSIVSGGWKLNLCAGDQCELFDLASDPHEQHNLFTDSRQKDRIRDLTARIWAWQHDTEDRAPLPSV